MIQQKQEDKYAITPLKVNRHTKFLRLKRCFRDQKMIYNFNKE